MRNGAPGSPQTAGSGSGNEQEESRSERHPSIWSPHEDGSADNNTSVDPVTMLLFPACHILRRGWPNPIAAGHFCRRLPNPRVGQAKLSMGVCRRKRTWHNRESTRGPFLLAWTSPIRFSMFTTRISSGFLPNELLHARCCFLRLSPHRPAATPTRALSSIWMPKKRGSEWWSAILSSTSMSD